MLLEQEHLLLVVGPAEELVPPQDILVPLLQDLATDHAGEAVEVEDEGLSAHDQLVRQEAVPATRALHGEQSGGKHGLGVSQSGGRGLRLRLVPCLVASSCNHTGQALL